MTCRLVVQRAAEDSTTTSPAAASPSTASSRAAVVGRTAWPAGSVGWMVEVVEAREGDWERVRAVRLAALEDTPDAFWSELTDEETQPESFWRGRLADGDRLTLLAVVDGVAVGTMGAGPHHEEGAEAGLYAVWVRPEARGGGAAEALLDQAIRWARGRGFTRLRLDVGDHNARAIRFYRRAGFTPTGVISTFPAPRDHITEHELAIDL